MGLIIHLHTLLLLTIFKKFKGYVKLLRFNFTTKVCEGKTATAEGFPVKLWCSGLGVAIYRLYRKTLYILNSTIMFLNLLERRITLDFGFLYKQNRNEMK